MSLSAPIGVGGRIYWDRVARTDWRCVIDNMPLLSAGVPFAGNAC